MRRRHLLLRFGLLVALLAGLRAAAENNATELPATEVRREVRLDAPPDEAFEELGKLFGIRVRATEDFSRRPLRLRLRQVDFAAAFRVAARVANAFWVVQPDGTVLVAPDTRNSRQRYQRQVERTFSLPGRTSDALNEAVRLLRDVLDMRRIRPDLRSSTITVWDTPHRLAVAEELLTHLHDDPGEVWVELLILEVDREEALRLGILPPDQAIAVHLGAGALALRREDVQSLLDVFQFLIDRGLLPEALTQAALQGLLAGGVFDPSQAGLVLPPFIIFGGGGTAYAANLPGATLSLSRLARVTRGWQRLTLRARSGEDATLFIGESFPIIFTTFSSIFIPEIIAELIRAGQFVPPVPAVRYEDLGVKLTVRPRVHPGREITLALKLDQKALTGQEFNGIPVLAIRALEQQVRLRDGETLLLAGLRQRRDERIRTGTPGLSSVPVLGHLFRQTVRTTRERELLLLLTPHIVRLPATERLVARTLYVGTEKEFSPVGPTPAARPIRPRPPTRPQPQAPPQPPQRQLPRPQPPQQPPPPPQT